jgi:hypothetical protein
MVKLGKRDGQVGFEITAGTRRKVRTGAGTGPHGLSRLQVTRRFHFSH